MYYWESADKVGKGRAEDWLFRVCEDAIPDDYRIAARDPQIRLVMTPTLIVHRGLQWEGSLALLAAHSLLVAGRTRSLGFRSDTNIWERWDITRYTTGMWSKRYFMIEGLDDYGDGPAFMFNSRHEADALAEYFAAGE
jgi:hypothetical protein